VYLKKISRGHSPRTPRGEGGERKGREGRRRGDKGKEEKGGRERRKEGKGKGIRVTREGIGPPQCLTQIDAPAIRYKQKMCSYSDDPSCGNNHIKGSKSRQKAYPICTTDTFDHPNNF
jgi:hypothetical protein